MAIHYCRHCGAIIPYGNSNCCPNCARKRADEQRWRESGKEVRPNAAGADLLKALAKPLLKLLKIFGVFLIISAVIWVILFFVYDVYKIDYSVVSESTRTVDGFTSFLLDHGFEARCRIGDSNEWEVYKFTYNYSNAVYDFNIDGYTYAK